MVNLDEIHGAIRPRMAQVLLLAQSSLPPAQYEAYRKLVLNEFGNSGLVKDLQRLFVDRKDRHG